MFYHNITKQDMLNGAGVRVVLWVSGCYHACKGCQNPQTWKQDSGILFDEAAKQELFAALEEDYISGITFSGGDPLATYNRETVFDIMREVKERFPQHSIWCYTGHSFEDIQDIPDIAMIDVLVDGKYVEELNTPSPRWCGSSNQRVIDMKETLKNNDIVLYI